MFKINNLTTIAMLILSIVVLASCEQDNSVTFSKSKAEMLVGNWKLDSAFSNNNPNNQLPKGELSIKFDSNGNYQMYQDSNVYMSGKWKFYYNDILFYSATSSKTLTSSISLFDKEMELFYLDGPYAFAEYYTKIK